MIVRGLLGLEEVVSLSVVDPIRDGRGWAFRDGPGYGPDPVNGFTLLREAYEATEPGYDGHISVPVLWDRETAQIVSNNFPDITIDLGTQFGAWAAPGIDLYPQPLRAEIDALNDRVYAAVNNGVYRCGFAGTQEAYDTAVAALFATLDELEERLAPPVPVRRADHRGGRAPVGHAGPFRQRLRHPFQGEHPPDRGLPEPLGLCA